MTLNSPKYFLSGLFFMLVGVGAVLMSMHLEFGTLRAIGPGFFPTVLGVILAVLGAILVFRAFVVDPEPYVSSDLKVAALVLGGSALFGILIRPAGLVIAIVAMILTAALATKELSFREAVLVAAGLAIGSVLVFVYALGLPIPVFGSLLRG